ncbi:LysR family transcriptional regulator [Aquabacterium sp. A7-Y]|uniref:LysR family transcriptional regulator n=1 Tax=Aquabacterium sp. A7-Y TaxID=1349605 RepID=UPI00223D32AA|nr:LysR family transcriptional regulator [Aquabacterium sp. A7-Y]MCW7538039.1 LysR family transcriptional regulator [Aquabacterium sp. A7-Y]
MDRLDAMQVFCRVAEQGSFSKAAEQLDLPRASVTGAVQQLERQLGVRLLHRTTRRVSLTQEGGFFLERCQRLLEEWAETENVFSGQLQPQGVVRVDLPERLARLTVIPALPAFVERFPGLQLRLSTTDRLVDPVAEAIDCLVRVGPLRDSTLVARRVGEMEQINCATPGYLDRHGRPQQPADLAQHVAVNYFSSRTGRDLDWEYVEDNGQVRTLKLPSRVSVSSSEAYLSCCLAGLGLMQAPRQGLEPLLEAGVLEEVLPRWKPPPLPVSIVYAHNRQLSPRVRVFVDWLAEVLKVS